MKLSAIEEEVVRRLLNQQKADKSAANFMADMPSSVSSIGIDQIAEENKKAIFWLGHVNLIVTGRSGSGKSTLINTVFRKNLAEVGVGLPVTQVTRCYEDPELPLRIYDTKGIELGADTQRQILDEIRQRVEDGLASGEPDKQIDMIWYCVNAGTNRIEPMELEWIRELASLHGASMIVVLTQCFREEAAKALKSVIEENIGALAKCVMVLAQDDPEDKKKKAFGLNRLLDTTMAHLPGEKKKLAFISAQGLDRKIKEEAARKCIPGFARNALLASTLSSSALVANEIAMCARITNIYGLDLDRHFFKEIITVMLGVAVATVGGRAAAKAAADAVLGWIPGERIVTGVINGATASSITLAFGQTYVTLLTMIDKGELSIEDLDTERLKSKIRSIFNKEYGKLLRLQKKERTEDAAEESADEPEGNAKQRLTLPNPFSFIKIGGKKNNAGKKS